MKRVLILNGSPRKGTTERVIEEFRRLLEKKGYETETFNVSHLNISPCTECLSCFVREGCIIVDPMQTLYDRLKKSDVVFLATPVFFSGPSAQLKAVIDRLEAFWAMKYIHGKKVRTGTPLVFGIVLGSRNSELDLRTTETILRAAATTFNGKYGGTFSILDAESPADLPEAGVLLEKIEKFVAEAGL